MIVGVFAGVTGRQICKLMHMLFICLILPKFNMENLWLQYALLVYHQRNWKKQKVNELWNGQLLIHEGDSNHHDLAILRKMERWNGLNCSVLLAFQLFLSELFLSESNYADARHLIDVCFWRRKIPAYCRWKKMLDQLTALLHVHAENDGYQMVSWQPILHYLWTPKPWNMKVLGPQYMGHNP